MTVRLLRKSGVLGAAVLALLSAGCAGDPATRFYSLAPIGAPTAAQSRDAGGAAKPVVSIGAIGLPEQVDRPQIVTTAPGADGVRRVRISEENRWAASLQSQIGQLLSDRLSTALGTPYVSVYPQEEPRRPDVRIAVTLQHFDAELGIEVIVDAYWTARSVTSDNTRSGSHHARIPVQAGGYEAIVSAFAKALDPLAGELTEAVRALTVPAVP